MEKISFRLYREHGALNSPMVFDAVESGLKKIGYKTDSAGKQIPVIWSVLWLGRMSPNREIYHRARSQNIPVLIIEVGNLQRNITWRISLNNVNGQGIFGNDYDIDPARHQRLGLHLHDPVAKRRPEILITTQHEHSLQWQNMPAVSTWVSETVQKIRQYSNRKIVVRPHPRWNRRLDLGDCQAVEIQQARKISGTYDDFDIDYNYHCVVNHNSGPTIQAAIAGIPIVCDSSSLAAPMSNSWNDLEAPRYFDRATWFSKLCHTEWTLDEIAQGIPFSRLRSEIEKYLL